MTRTIWRALRTAAVTLVLTGVLYPVATTGLAQLLFSRQATGSLVADDRGRVVGSELIGQRFVGTAYFWPRPSAAGEAGYDATASSGSNLGPTSRKLRENLTTERARLIAANPDAPAAVPVDLVTASASGLDPHLSPAAVLWQVPRVARGRGLAPERVRQVAADHIEDREFGFLGEPRVNVLRLNLALDRHFGPPPHAK